MTKSELIDAVTSKVEGLTRKQIETIVQIIFEGLQNALIKNEKVEIRGFGIFTIKKRASRIARNPKTGEMVKVPPKKSIHFKIGRPLHDALNSIKTM